LRHSECLNSFFSMSALLNAYTKSIFNDCNNGDLEMEKENKTDMPYYGNETSLDS
jgi:hypothetical protein